MSEPEQITCELDERIWAVVTPTTGTTSPLNYATCVLFRDSLPQPDDAAIVTFAAAQRMTTNTESAI